MENRAVPADPAAILEAVAAPIVVYDPEYRFAYANQAFCRSVHKTWPVLEGRKVADLVCALRAVGRNEGGKQCHPGNLRSGRRKQGFQHTLDRPVALHGQTRYRTCVTPQVRQLMYDNS